MSTDASASRHHDRASAWTRLTPVVLFGFGLAGMAASYTLELGSIAVPGAGLWPFLTFGAVALSAVFIVPLDRTADYERWDRRSLRVLAGIAVLALFVVLFEPIGFLIPAMGMAVVWMRVFGRESWRTTLILSVIGSVGLFLLFDRGLEVPFPEGPESVLLDQIGA